MKEHHQSPCDQPSKCLQTQCLLNMKSTLKKWQVRVEGMEKKFVGEAEDDKEKL